MKMMRKKGEDFLIRFDEAIYDASLYEVVESAPVAVEVPEPKKTRKPKSKVVVPEEVPPAIEVADYAIGRADAPDDFDFGEDM